MSTKSANRAKKGTAAPEASTIVLPKPPSNELFDGLAASYADIMHALLSYNGLFARIKENTETVKRIRNKAQFETNLQVLVNDVAYLTSESSALYKKHKHLSGSAEPSQITWAFGLLEGYTRIAVSNEEATKKIANELMNAMLEAETILNGEMIELRKNNPEAAAAADAVMDAEDKAVQAQYDAQQASNPAVVTDVAFVDTPTTVH